MDALNLRFEVDRETKGTVRFKEAGIPPGVRPAVGTLYVTKDALDVGWPDGPPNRLAVTIRAAE